MSELVTPSEVWSRFTLLLSRDVLARRYQQMHGGEMNAGQASEIIAHLLQGREYFDAAATAGAFVRPLLQYYGVLALSRAIILFRTPGLRESALKPAHGLTARLMRDMDLAELGLSVSGGTFYELLTATANLERFHASYMPTAEAGSLSLYGLGTSTEFRFSLPAPSVAAVFGFRDLLVRMPELRLILEESLSEQTRCYRCMIQVWAPDSYTRVSLLPERFKLPDVASLQRALFGEATCRAWESTQGALEFELSHQSLEGLAGILPRVIDGDAIGSYIVERYPGGWELSSLASLFVGSYVLSTFVRYHPTRWAALASGAKGDALLPVLLKLRDLIQTQFVPLAICEFEPPATPASLPG
jgi:YaaC-like Protein